MGELLLYGGVIVAGASVLIGTILFAVLWKSKRRLNAKLDAEYGKKQ